MQCTVYEVHKTKGGHHALKYTVQAISGIYNEVIGEIEENYTSQTALLVKSAMQFIGLTIGIMKALPMNSKLHTK